MPRKRATAEERAARIFTGERIRMARNRLHVSQAVLAAAFGVTRQAVQFWERGESFPPGDDIPRLCRLLGVGADHLLGINPATFADDETMRAELLRIAAEAKPPKPKGGPARKVPGKRGRPTAAA